MKRLLKNEWFWVIFLSLIAVFLSLLSTFYEISVSGKVPGDRQFILDYGLPGDFNVYINRILQGQEGRWLVYEDYSSDYPKGSLLQIFYLFLGKIFFVFDPVFVFHLSRVLVGFVWAIAGFIFIRKFVREKAIRVAAFLFFLFSMNFPVIIAGPDKTIFDLYGSGFTEYGPMYRATNLPHLHVSHIFIVLALLAIVKFWGTKSLKYAFLACISGFLAAIILPPTIMVAWGIVGTLITWWFLSSCRTRFGISKVNLKKVLKQVQDDGPKILGTTIFYLVSAIPLVYLLLLLRQYPWKSLQDALLDYHPPFDFVDYLYALGPISILGIAGAVVSVLKRRSDLFVASFWVLVTFGAILFFNEHRTLQHPTRFTQVAIELPLSVLAAYLLWEAGRLTVAIGEWLGNFKNVILGVKPEGSRGDLVYTERDFSAVPQNDKSKNAVFLILVFLILLPAPLVYAIGFKNRVDFVNARVGAGWPLVPEGLYVVYPVRDFMEGIYWIKANTKRSDVVLGGTVSGNYIPAYAGNLVYIGHGHQTPFYWHVKLPLVKRFYQGQMTDEEAKKFLLENNISYVYFGPEEREWRGDELRLSFLKKVYEKGTVSVFAVSANKKP